MTKPKKEKKELYNQSETITIKRSQINFAPFNPKKHTDEQIAQMRKNIKSVGFLGGIIWNEQTQNLVDGHKRTMSLDIIHKYDGTPETDYEINSIKILLSKIFKNRDFTDEERQKGIFFQNNLQSVIKQDITEISAENLIENIDYTFKVWQKKPWVSLGKKTATNKPFLNYNTPKNAVLWLKNHTRGKEEQIFIYKNNQQVFPTFDEYGK